MTSTKLRSGAARAALALAACGGTMLLATPTASAAAPTVPGLTNPPQGQTFTVPECTSTVSCDNTTGATDVGAPVAFNVTGTGFTQGSNVSIEICDGKAPNSPNYSVASDCDSATSPPYEQIAANNPNGNVSWGTGAANANSYNEIEVFRGVSPGNKFNCLAPGDNPNSTTTLDGETINKSLSSYTNCQLRMDTSLQSNITPTYVTLAIPNTPTPPTATPEAPVAVLLPVGAAALLGGGFFLTRRRRHQRSAA